MRKQFIGYSVISVMVLCSLLISYFVTDSQRNEWIRNDCSKIDNLSYCVYHDEEIDYLSQKIGDLSFNESYLMNEIKSIKANSNFAGGYVTVGSIENGTDDKHGLLQLIEFDATDILVPEPQISDIYLNTTLAETEYLVIHSITTSFDSTSNNPTLIALKKIITTNTFDIDIFDVSVGSLSLNNTIRLNSTIFGSIYEIAIYDTNSDNLFEIYVLGENATNSDNMLLAEFAYNETSTLYEQSEILEWEADNLVILGMEYIVESSTVNFIITGVNASSIESFLVAISIQRDDIRNFSFETINHLDYGSDIFRMYNMELYNSNESQNRRIALFGTYISSSVNYQSCVTLSYTLGVFSLLETITNELNVGWSNDGLITDIDMDNNDEIILTSYDWLSLTRSSFTILSNNDLEQIDAGLTSTYRIRSCASLNLEFAHIGSWLGYDNDENHFIEFHLTSYIPIRIKANSLYLNEQTENEFQIQFSDLFDNKISRSDVSIFTYLESHPEVNFTTPLGSDQIILNLSLISDDIQNTIIIFEVRKDNLTLSIHSFEIDVITIPEFSITLPPNPIVLRNAADRNQIIQLTIENPSNIVLSGIVYVTTEISNYEISVLYQTEANSSSQQYIPIVLANDPNLKNYTENLTIIIQGGEGIFQFQIPLIVKSTAYILPVDLLNAFWIILSIVIVFYFALLFLTYRVNKESIRKHIADDEPLQMDLPWFKNKAIENLTKEYSVAGNWELGIKLTEEYLPHKLSQFHQYRARELLLKGQNLAWEGKFFDTLTNWQQARESLVVLANNQWIDIIDWILDPLSRVVEARKMKNKEKKAAALLNEFQLLNGLSVQSRRILGIDLTIPLYFVAEDLGLAYKDIEDLQNSLTYLQFAYQYAPDFYKNRIIQQITHLIGMGVQPREMAVPSGQEGIEERLARRTVRCYSCGEEKSHGQEKCPNCGIDTVQCSVCKLPISFGADTAECPHCENIAHKEHLQEWVKVKGTCPVCQRNLKTNDIETSISTEE